MMMALMLMTMLISACGSKEFVMEVGDSEVGIGEATFVLREMEANYEQQYGVEIWNQGVEGVPFDQVVKEGALDSIKRMHISYNVALEKGLELNEADDAELEGLVEDYLQVIPLDTLASDGITREDVKKVFEINKFIFKLMDVELVDFTIDQARLDEALVNDSDYQQLLQYGANGVLEEVTVQQVFIATVNEDGSEMTEEALAEADQLASKVLEEALAGEAFESLVAQYSEDPNWPEDAGVMNFFRGQTIVEFETPAFEMDINEIRRVETPDGYYIVKKMDHVFPAEEEVAEVSQYQDYIVERHELSQKREAFDGIYEGWAATYDVTVNQEVWDKIMTSYEKAKASSEEVLPE